MALTPLDVHHKEFKSARFGGYNEEDVDTFLDLVADELERQLQENSDLKERIEAMRKRLAEFEEMQSSLQSALLTASKSAEEVKEQARQEAEATLDRARKEADSTVSGSQEQARQMLLNAQGERQRLERSFAGLRDIKRRYLQSIRDLAEANLAQVAEVEARDEAEYPREEAAPAGAKAPAAGIEGPPLVESPRTRVDSPGQPVPSVPARPYAPRQEAAIEPPQAPSPPPAPPAPPAQRVTGEEEGRDSAEQVPGQAGPVEAQAPGRVETPAAAERERPPSSDLVEEVLDIEGAEDVYGGLEDAGGEEAGRGRKGRGDKREKNFFWE